MFQLGFPWPWCCKVQGLRTTWDSDHGVHGEVYREPALTFLSIHLNFQTSHCLGKVPCFLLHQLGIAIATMD
jgi:hypothetical protein